ncbi:hypothetical protein AMTRI_Chr08g166820 [Amborella trichopoda]
MNCCWVGGNRMGWLLLFLLLVVVVVVVEARSGSFMPGEKKVEELEIMMEEGRRELIANTDDYTDPSANRGHDPKSKGGGGGGRKTRGDNP